MFNFTTLECTSLYNVRVHVCILCTERTKNAVLYFNIKTNLKTMKKKTLQPSATCPVGNNHQMNTKKKLIKLYSAVQYIIQ